MIRMHFQAKKRNNAQEKTLESDLALLNLSDSSDDEEESKIASDSALNVIENFEEDIYGSSIETLLSLNSTNHLE